MTVLTTSHRSRFTDENGKEYIMKTKGTAIAIVSSFGLLLATAAVAQQETSEFPVPPPSSAPPEIPAHSTEPEQGIREPSAQSTSPLSPGHPVQQGTLLSSSTLVGATVKNLEGEDLGKIQELLIDPQSGRVSAAVLSVGGMLGMGAKHVAVSWDTFRNGLGEGDLIAALSKEQLENAPSFEAN
jgi:sporulation protein YlmC with PRC-barrel domain